MIEHRLKNKAEIWIMEHKLRKIRHKYENNDLQKHSRSSKLNMMTGFKAYDLYFNKKNA